MPKKIKRNPYPAPPIDDFIRTHEGRELLSYSEAAQIFGYHPKTVSVMVRDGRLTGVAGKVHLRSIYAYLWPQKKGAA